MCNWIARALSGIAEEELNWCSCTCLYPESLLLLLLLPPFLPPLHPSLSLPLLVLFLRYTARHVIRVSSFRGRIFSYRSVISPLVLLSSVIISINILIYTQLHIYIYIWVIEIKLISVRKRDF